MLKTLALMLLLFLKSYSRLYIFMFDLTTNRLFSFLISGSRPGSSASSTASMSLNRVDIDEYLHLLREKVKSNFHETRTRFRNADQDGKGGLSKEAFAHLIASILGPSKPLSHQHFVKLIEKLGLKNRPIIKYNSFEKQRTLVVFFPS